jgi:hypothetical protein
VSNAVLRSHYICQLFFTVISIELFTFCHFFRAIVQWLDALHFKDYALSPLFVATLLGAATNWG